MSNPGQHPSSSCLPVRCWQVLSSSRCATSFQTALPPYNRTASAVWISTVRSQRRQGDAQHVALNLGKTSLPQLGSGRIGARVFEDRFPIFRREWSIRRRSGGVRPTGGFGGQLFHLHWGRHAPARGSVGHSELEHKENKSRIRSRLFRENILLLETSRCRNQAGPFVLNPASVVEFPRHGPPR
jgi:hypothetical protein